MHNLAKILIAVAPILVREASALLDSVTHAQDKAQARKMSEALLDGKFNEWNHVSIPNVVTVSMDKQKESENE